MTTPDQFGRQIKAQYKFSGAVAELEAPVPRDPLEPVLLAGVARLHSPGHLPRPLVLRLTPSHLVALQHHAIGADHVLDLPHAAIDTITLNGHVITVT